MIPVSYTVRNIVNHKITSFLTILGISLVVFVFAGSLMLTRGLSDTLVASGSDGNVTLIRQAAQTEVQSIIYKDQAQIVRNFPEIMADENGAPLITTEIYVIISRLNRKTGGEGNIAVRGITNQSIAIRPNVHIVEGRMWTESGSEILAGRQAAERFEGCGLGETVRFGMRDWTVVGIFDAGGSSVESELWCDVTQAGDAFDRPVYSSLTFRVSDTASFLAVKEKIEDDQRLKLEVNWEKEYYAKQSRSISTFLNIAGSVISIIFSLGAIVGAMITMYAAVANRIKEIGTLRSLGFSRFSILSSFLFESILISFIGGVIGVAGAYTLRYVKISTTNWDTFSEIAFNFEISVPIITYTLIFAILMGIIGGFLPAVRAARMKIVDSLRA
ncbi:MAG: ABC transporter permease [Candidatus Zixiibacteriota bacterium]